MAFNKEYAQAAGVLPLIHQGWTIADFKAALSGLHKAGYVPGSIFCSGSVGDATRALVSNLSGTPVINDDFSHYTLTDGAESINVLAFLQQAVKDGLLTDGSLLSGRKDIQRFIDGKTAFTILWSGTQQSSSQAELDSHHIETIEIPFPAQAGHQPQLEYLINGFAIGKAHDKEKLAAAKRFIHYICDDSQMGRMSVLASGSIPVRKSFANLIAISHRQQLADWTEYYAPYYNIVPGFEKMRNIWYTTLQAMLRDDMSPQEAAASFTRAADATLVLPAKVVQP
jgi:multiple sugar transport system substrate-binding protein